MHTQANRVLEIFLCAHLHLHVCVDIGCEQSSQRFLVVSCCSDEGIGRALRHHLNKFGNRLEIVLDLLGSSELAHSLKLRQSNSDFWFVVGILVNMRTVCMQLLRQFLSADIQKMNPVFM